MWRDGNVRFHVKISNDILDEDMSFLEVGFNLNHLLWQKVAKILSKYIADNLWINEQL